MLSVYRLLFLVLVGVIISQKTRGQGQRQSNRIFKRIVVPKGSSLALTVQVSRPKILTNFIVNEKAIILDGVVEVPMWLDLDRFVDAVYNVTREEDRQGPIGPKSNNDEFSEMINFRGRERCILYNQLESLLSTVLLLPNPTAKACLLQVLCEIHEMSTFYFPWHSPSFTFELFQLFFTPSLGGKDECHQPYLKAEDTGKQGLCYINSTKCPINISGLIFKYLIPRNF